MSFLLALILVTQSSIPERFNNAVPGRHSAAPWWTLLGDPIIAALADEALEGNVDLKVARDRVLQAEALARQSRAGLMPVVSVDTSANALPFESIGFQFGGGGGSQPGQPAPPDIFYRGSAMLTGALQADIWGRTWVTYRAALFDAAASRDDRDGQAAAIAAIVAQTAIDVAAAKARLDIAERQLEVNEKFLELIEARFKQGSATALDVLQQRQQAAAASAALPQARSLLHASRQRLAVLLGRDPTAELPQATATLPDAADLPATGTPADLIEARADLRAARARADASEQRRKGAFRALLPTLRVSSQIGYQGNYSAEMTTQGTWGIGATLSLPLFEGGLTWAGIEHAAAASSAAANRFRQAMLTAIQEVETAVVGDVEQRRHLAAVLAQEKAARLAFNEARARYLNGVDTYLNVLTALSIYEHVQLAVVQSRRDTAVSRIQLYNALGGAWTKGLGQAGTR